MDIFGNLKIKKMKKYKEELPKLLMKKYGTKK